MIDDPIKTQRLLERLQATLPVPARATPELMAMLKKQNASALPSPGFVTGIHYAGDEGGIMCQLPVADKGNTVHVSITHLRFDPRHALTREIATYQKHRVKQIRRGTP